MQKRYLSETSQFVNNLPLYCAHSKQQGQGSMAIQLGTHLGPYEILSAIGAGARARTVARCAIALLTTMSLMTGPARVSGESDANGVQAHVALAKAAAGQDHIALF